MTTTTLARGSGSSELSVPRYAAGLSALDPREREVLRLLSKGLTNRQIAQEIYYSLGTVKNVVQSIIEKLGVSDRLEAAMLAGSGLDDA